MNDLSKVRCTRHCADVFLQVLARRKSTTSTQISTSADMVHYQGAVDQQTTPFTVEGPRAFGSSHTLSVSDCGATQSKPLNTRSGHKLGMSYTVAVHSQYTASRSYSFKLNLMLLRGACLHLGGLAVLACTQPPACCTCSAGGGGGGEPCMCTSVPFAAVGSRACSCCCSCRCCWRCSGGGGGAAGAAGACAAAAAAASSCEAAHA